MSQAQSVLNYLQEHGEIGPREALNELGVYRLAARIHDIRREHDVETRRVEVVNAHGDTAVVARYALVNRRTAEKGADLAIPPVTPAATVWPEEPVVQNHSTPGLLEGVRRWFKRVAA